MRQDGDSGRADGCVVCAGNPIEVLIEPCGHVAVCQDCVKRMHRDESKCISSAHCTVSLVFPCSAMREFMRSVFFCPPVYKEPSAYVVLVYQLQFKFVCNQKLQFWPVLETFGQP